ncbi:TIGR02996 domain-containing protein [Limnoglobus roseus]|uniref:TIGR02996 domain-containing protein n=1 Tax=Limnoglobus roseus TaxID=2598579 RepID=A0A5C1AUR3_9BACT|nr:TIGR02996 domain-containing protein [Limnoglobus roseus]QEL20528.1 TIGR02996 domain-containing protein [Limnoglobus roseus]
MSDGHALLAAVLASPGDDLPRLVYGDWLEENGEPEWAAVIRVMCAQPHEFDADVQVERMGAGRPVPAVTTTLAWLESHAPHHLSMLLGGRKCGRVSNERPWVTGCPSLGLRVEWRRGFIALVQGSIEVVQTHLPRIVARHPVERADATNKEPFRAEWLGNDSLYSWRGITGDDAGPHDLPPRLFDLLPGHRYCGPGWDHFRNYPTPESSLTALSAALLIEALAALT